MGLRPEKVKVFSKDGAINWYEDLVIHGRLSVMMLSRELKISL
jgi:hypothetical protein